MRSFICISLIIIVGCQGNTDKQKWVQETKERIELEQTQEIYAKRDRIDEGILKFEKHNWTLKTHDKEYLLGLSYKRQPGNLKIETEELDIGISMSNLKKLIEKKVIVTSRFGSFGIGNIESLLVKTIKESGE